MRKFSGNRGSPFTMIALLGVIMLLMTLPVAASTSEVAGEAIDEVPDGTTQLIITLDDSRQLLVETPTLAYPTDVNSVSEVDETVGNVDIIVGEGPMYARLENSTIADDYAERVSEVDETGGNVQSSLVSTIGHDAPSLDIKIW